MRSDAGGGDDHAWFCTVIAIGRCFPTQIDNARCRSVLFIRTFESDAILIAIRMATYEFIEMSMSQHSSSHHGFSRSEISGTDHPLQLLVQG